jgi:hypothetical protein
VPTRVRDSRTLDTQSLLDAQVSVQGVVSYQYDARESAYEGRYVDSTKRQAMVGSWRKRAERFTGSLPLLVSLHRVSNRCNGDMVLCMKGRAALLRNSPFTCWSSRFRLLSTVA